MKSPKTFRPLWAFHLPFSISVLLIIIPELSSASLPSYCKETSTSEDITCYGRIPNCYEEINPEDLRYVKTLSVEDCEEPEVNITHEGTTCFFGLLHFRIGCKVNWLDPKTFHRWDLGDIQLLGGVASIPPELFCNMFEDASVTIQNVDYHPEVDLTSPCQSKATTLNVSSNVWTELPQSFLGQFPLLRKLYAENNGIGNIPPTTFWGFEYLTDLSLAHNRISSLSPDVFGHCPLLVEINLSFNQLEALPSGIFVNQTSLWRLRLDYNRLTTLGGALTPDLGELYLSHNALTTLSSVLSSLPKLRILCLDCNRIREIRSDDLRDLVNLGQMNLSSNLLTSLATDAFDFNSELGTLVLEDNQLHAIPKLPKFDEIKILKLGRNNITEINADAFQHATTMTLLGLDNNAIEVLTKHSLGNLRELDTLDLSHNRILKIHRSFLRNFYRLKHWNLDHNLLTSAAIEGPYYDEAYTGSVLFTQIDIGLRVLDISWNLITRFEYSWFPEMLQNLTLSHNCITSLPVYKVSSDRKPPYILFLDLSFNRLTTVTASTLPTSAHVLTLSNNRIKTIDGGAFYHLFELKSVDLSQNHLEVIVPMQFEGSVKPTVHLQQNPWICDCRTYWLATSAVKRFTIDHPENVSCKMAAVKADRAVKSLTDLKPNDSFLCAFRRDPANKGQSISEIPGLKCNGSECPGHCLCYCNNYRQTIHVDCSSANLTAAPPIAASFAMSYYLDGNKIESIDETVLANLSILAELYLNATQLKTVASETFSAVFGLEVLHLDHNSLTDLPVNLFANLSKLRLLDLSNNAIVRLNRWTFSPLKSIQSLNLQGNRLKIFSVSTFSSISGTLQKLWLASNPWRCRCNNALVFGEWLEAQEKILRNKEHLNCTLQTSQDTTAVILAPFSKVNKWFKQYDHVCSNDVCATIL